MNQKQSTKQILLKLGILLALIGIAAYLMKDSLMEIMQEVMQTPFSILLLLCLCGGMFYVFEGLSFMFLSKRYAPSFQLKDGIGCAYYVNFFRVVTFGSGTVASNMFYLNRCQIPPSKSIGLVTIHNIFYQVAVIFWAFVGFVFNYDLMRSTFGDYFVFLLLGCLGAFIFIGGMVLFAVSKRFHAFIMKVARFLFRKEQWNEKLNEADQMFETARKETEILLHDKKTLATLFGIHVIRMLFWYVIPVVLFHPNSIGEAFTLMSLMAMILAMAGVIPSPAGIGGLEVVYMAFFSVIAQSIQAATTLLLYRFATYLLPLIISVVVMFWTEMKIKKDQA